jgi:hypothetical protein
MTSLSRLLQRNSGQVPAQLPICNTVRCIIPLSDAVTSSSGYCEAHSRTLQHSEWYNCWKASNAVTPPIEHADLMQFTPDGRYTVLIEGLTPSQNNDGIKVFLFDTHEGSFSDLLDSKTCTQLVTALEQCNELRGLQVAARDESGGNLLLKTDKNRFFLLLVIGRPHLIALPAQSVEVPPQSPLPETAGMPEKIRQSFASDKYEYADTKRLSVSSDGGHFLVETRYQGHSTMKFASDLFGISEGPVAGYLQRYDYQAAEFLGNDQVLIWRPPYLRRAYLYQIPESVTRLGIFESAAR